MYEWHVVPSNNRERERERVMKKTKISNLTLHFMHPNTIELSHA